MKTNSASRQIKNVRMTVFYSLMILVLSCGLVNQHAAAQEPVPGKSWNIPLPGNTPFPTAWIPAGTFTMGTPDSEQGRKADESPQTRVTLTKGYWLGTTEVTIGQWNAVTGQSLRDKVLQLLNDETLYDFDGKKMKERDFMHFDKNDPDKIMANEDDRLPMYFVSWNEAMGFCKKLTEEERAKGRLPVGYEYTLPTEAQWEYACRAGTTGQTYSDASLADVAWYVKNSFIDYADKGLGNPPAGPRDVGAKLANKWGMQDILGNIWEWCRDWYGPYPGGSVTDPTGPKDGAYRVNRGGSFGSGAFDERSGNRAKNPPNEDSAYRGFRVALCAVQQ